MQEPSAQASFIAAARRAAQASASSSKSRAAVPAKGDASSVNAISGLLSQMRREMPAKGTGPANGGDDAPKSNSAGMPADSGSPETAKKRSSGTSRRRTFLIALAGLVVILGSLQTLRTLQLRHQQAAAVVETLPDSYRLPSTPGAPADPAPAAPVPASQAPEPNQRDSALSPKMLGSEPGQLVAGKSTPALSPETFDRMPVGSTPRQPAAAPAPVQQAMGLAEAAAAGIANAQFELGSRLADGRGMARDSRNAQVWFEKAALQGLAPAQYRLGSLYERGMGVDRDLKRAYDWYSKAAALGNVRAMHNLAVLNAEGIDGSPDYKAAAGWFLKAAEYGVRDSQYNLAILYARGLGIEQNLQLSWAWFNTAALQGDEDAAKKRDDVAVRLDAGQLAAAKATAAAFRPKTPDQASNEVPQPADGWAAPRAGQTSDPRSDARTSGKGKVSSL